MLLCTRQELILNTLHSKTGTNRLCLQNSEPNPYNFFFFADKQEVLNKTWTEVTISGIVQLELFELKYQHLN